MSLDFVSTYTQPPVCELCKQFVTEGDVVELVGAEMNHWLEGYREDVQPGEWATSTFYASTGVVHLKCYNRAKLALPLLERFEKGELVNAQSK